MRALVAASSRHGATGAIAEEIGRTLAGHGLDVQVTPLDDVSDVSGFDAFVVGSAIYAGRWLGPARTFVDEHGAELRSRPTWLFSSGPLGDPPKPDPDAAVKIDGLVQATGAREHHLFTGALDRSRLGLERAIVRVVGAPDGDFRDWDDVRRGRAPSPRRSSNSRLAPLPRIDVDVVDPPVAARPDGAEAQLDLGRAVVHDRKRRQVREQEERRGWAPRVGPVDGRDGERQRADQRVDDHADAEPGVRVAVVSDEEAKRRRVEADAGRGRCRVAPVGKRERLRVALAADLEALVPRDDGRAVLEIRRRRPAQARRRGRARTSTDRPRAGRAATRPHRGSRRGGRRSRQGCSSPGPRSLR